MLELISVDDVKKRGHSEYVKFNHPIKVQPVGQLQPKFSAKADHLKLTTGDWIDKLNDTKERRKNQTCRTYEIKIDKSHLNNETENQLEMLSLEAKWYCNHIRSKIQTRYKYDEKNGIYIQINKNQESLFDMDYKIDEVTVKIGYRYELRELKYLTSQMKQELLDRIKDDVKRLSEKKKKGHNVGKLKFKNDVRSVPLKQYGNTYKILDDKYITIQGVKQKIRVRGLSQILDHNNEKENIEVANADFINKHGDFYLHIVTYQDKKVAHSKMLSVEKEIIEPKSIGIDFGIAKQLTLSNGIRIEYNIPIPKSLKRKYKKLSRQERFSKGWYKTKTKIQKEFDKLTNIKNDIKNKIVHRLCDQYNIVCYQDDNVKSWQRIWGRRILETSIGKIKSDIDKKIQIPIEVDRFFPSTKRCSRCGHEREIDLDERIYECFNPKCQIKKDRDWNSAMNIENEGLRNRDIVVGTGRIDLKPVEIEPSTLYTTAICCHMEYFNGIPYVKASSVVETGSLTALA